MRVRQRVDTTVPWSEVKPGDLIEKVDGDGISSSEELVAAIRKHKPGDTVKLGIDRDGKSLELEAKLMAAKDLKRE